MVTKKLKNEYFLIYAIILFIFSCSLFFHYTVDDAYITLRYSENFVNTGQIVWNDGEEPIEGFTNWSWMIIGSLILIFGGNIFALKIVGIIMSIISIILFNKLITKNKYKNIFLLILVCTPEFIIWSVGGLETSLFVTVFLLILIVYKKRKFYLTSFLIILLYLTRPEGSLVILAIVCHQIHIQSKIYKDKNYIDLVKIIAPFTIILSLIVLVKLNYFHSVLPNSFYFKKEFMGGINYIIKFYARFAPISILFLYLILKRKMKEQSLLLAFVIFITLAYLNINPLMGNYFRFFVILIIPLYMMLSDQHKTINKKLFITTLIIILIINITLIAHYLNSTREYSTGLSNAHKVLAYDLIGDNVSSIAIGDAGIVPYITKANTIDTLGLNSPNILQSSEIDKTVIKSKPKSIILLSKNRIIFEPLVENDKILFSSPLLEEYYFLEKKYQFSESYYLWTYKLK